MFPPADEQLSLPGNAGSSIYRKRLLLLIFLMSAFRLILAFGLELGNDEAYYWLYSQHLQWNYIDHPPMVAIWIRIFTGNLALEQYEGFLRLGSVVGAALSTWFIYQATAMIHTERAGLMAAILYQSSFYAGITAGLFVLPDAPEMVFWTLTLWFMARLVKEDDSWINWILLGLCAGFCILSKIHGAFLWLGIFGFVLIKKRNWLYKPQLYVSFLVTLILLLPLLFWNLHYDLATLHLHSRRFHYSGAGFNLKGLLVQAGGQLVFAHPLTAILSIVALLKWKSLKVKLNGVLVLYIFTSLPLILTVWIVSLFINNNMPHWAGPAYVSLLPLAAIYLAGISQQIFPSWLKWSLGIFVVYTIAWALFLRLLPGTYGAQGKNNLGSGDFTLDMYGWKDAAGKFSGLYQEDMQKGKISRDAIMVTSLWWGAHQDYYFARPLGLPMLGLGRPDQVGQYLWVNATRRGVRKICDAYCIIPSDMPCPLPASYFNSVEMAAIIPVYRGGRMAKELVVYRMRGLKQQVPFIR